MNRLPGRCGACGGRVWWNGHAWADDPIPVVGGTGWYRYEKIHRCGR